MFLNKLWSHKVEWRWKIPVDILKRRLLELTQLSHIDINGHNITLM